MYEQEIVTIEEKSSAQKEKIVLPANFMRYLNYSTLTSLPLKDLSKTNSDYKTFYKYTKEQILTYVKSPDRNEKNLREASIYLYNGCSYYSRVINHFSKMLTFGYVLTPSKLDLSKANPDKIKVDYQKKSHLLETMDVKDSFRAPVSVAMREDVSYNYVIETKDSFMFQGIDPDYCKLSSKSDNIYNFAFNFQYFNGKENLLPLYPPEFTTKYNTYKAQGTTMQWQELDVKNTFVLKANFDINYPIPPFVGAFEAIYDIIDYKSLQLAKTETGNYKVLSMKLPINEKGDFAIDFDLAKQFYNQMGQTLPDNIGLALSPMEIEPFDFERSASNSETDMVRSAEQNFFSSAGVSTLLFNNEKASSNALAQSIKCDEAIIWGLLSQIERWINRYLKYQTGNQKFHVIMPRMTVYNEKEKAEEYLKGCQSGMPTKMLYGAAIGLTPSDMMSLNFLENDILEMPNKLIPLQTSYTMSSGDGRPTNKSKGLELTESGEISQDRGE
ncbi:MAG: hypothetical protein RR370_01795 [Synergistaceae bacterium]